MALWGASLTPGELHSLSSLGVGGPQNHFLGGLTTASQDGGRSYSRAPGPADSPGLALAPGEGSCKAGWPGPLVWIADRGKGTEL